MDTYALEVESNFFELLVLSCMFIACLLIQKKGRSVPGHLFVWGVFCFFLSDVYWCAMLFSAGEGTYRFSATDMGVIGGCLLWMSYLSIRDEGKRLKPQFTLNFIVLVCFGIFNPIWWIGWNGYWVSNLLEGVIFLLLMLKAYVRLQSSGILNVRICRTVTVLLTAISILQFSGFAIDGELYNILSVIINVLVALLLAVVFIEYVLMGHRSTEYAILGFVFSRYIMFMTSGIMYSIITFVGAFWFVFAVYAYLCESGNIRKGRNGKGAKV